MNSILDEIRHSIIENPDEDMPRYAYADAVEPDDPEYAEFIRLQLELAKMPPCIVNGISTSTITYSKGGLPTQWRGVAKISPKMFDEIRRNKLVLISDDKSRTFFQILWTTLDWQDSYYRIGGFTNIAGDIVPTSIDSSIVGKVKRVGELLRVNDAWPVPKEKPSGYRWATSPVYATCESYQFVRGFVEDIELPWANFSHQEWAKNIFRVNPIRNVTITTALTAEQVAGFTKRGRRLPLRVELLNEPQSAMQATLRDLYPRVKVNFVIQTIQHQFPMVSFSHVEPMAYSQRVDSALREQMMNGSWYTPPLGLTLTPPLTASDFEVTARMIRDSSPNYRYGEPISRSDRDRIDALRMAMQSGIEIPPSETRRLMGIAEPIDETEK